MKTNQKATRRSSPKHGDIPPPYCYDHPHPSVTADMVVFATREVNGSLAGLDVLLIRRKHPPYAGTLALPGGFVEIDESIEAAAARELKEETGLVNVSLEQFHAFSEPLRDPRERIISVAFWGLISSQHASKARHGDDAAEIEWVPVREACRETLAFDHDKILDMAISKASLGIATVLGARLLCTLSDILKEPR